MKKNLINMILVIMLVLVGASSQAQVVNPKVSTVVDTDAGSKSDTNIKQSLLGDEKTIWVDEDIKGLRAPSRVLDLYAENCTWFVTDDCRTLFQWDGSNLIVTDISLEPNEISVSGNRVVEWDNSRLFHTVQSDGSLTSAYTQPSVYSLSFSAVHGWKNKKEREEPFLFGYASYKKKSTAYIGMLLGGIDNQEENVDILFLYDVIIEKNKLTLKIYRVDMYEDELKEREIFKKVFVAEQ